jgi:ABC-2 type transport system permease protein
MRPELIVAEKEFRDHLTSKRFLIILAVLLLLAAYSIATGVGFYNNSLESYKQHKATGASQYQVIIDSIEESIADAEQQGMDAAYIENLKQDLENVKNNQDYFLNPDMPSMLTVFQSFTVLFAILGMVLGIAMGFDQITKERESGSLKTVLSAPLYRDSLINGKAIGSMACLAVAIAATFLVTLAILLFMGIVPGVEDLIRIGLFFVGSMLYCTAFFAIATLTSALSRNSAMAIIWAIAIVFVLFFLSIASSMISMYAADVICGPSPPVYQTPMVGENNTVVSIVSPTRYEGPINEYSARHSQIQMQVSDMLSIVSPIYDYSGMGSMYPGIAQALLSDEKPYGYSTIYGPYSSPERASILDSLSYIWMKALALIIEMSIALALSYVLFMRADVR